MMKRYSFCSLLCVLWLGGVTMAVAAESGPPAAAPDLAAWRSSVETELRGDILPFWIKYTVDHERGGFYGQISNDLVVKKDAPRGALLTSRILWTYSHAYRTYQDPAYLQMAKWAYDDLMKRFWDPQFGGLFWTVSANGQPLEPEKQIYGQAFGVYALAEYNLATHDQEALDKAIALYHLIYQHAHDPKFGGYWEVCRRDWTRETNTRKSTVAPDATKSQNTHLHILEAFTNLLRPWPDPELRKNQLEVVELMTTKILNQKTHHLILFQNDDWTPTTNDMSFGHDIEFSWLLTEAGEVLGDEALNQRLRGIALEVARVTLEQGVNADGSLPYEASPTKVTNPYREWWPQAEAAVGFYNAYQLSGDKRYLAASQKAWNYIETQLVDRQHGEWFAGRYPNGAISKAPKVSLWKCPYHNSRSCFELVRRFDEAKESSAAK